MWRSTQCDTWNGNPPKTLSSDLYPDVRFLRLLHPGPHLDGTEYIVDEVPTGNDKVVRYF